MYKNMQLMKVLLCIFVTVTISVAAQAKKESQSFRGSFDSWVERPKEKFKDAKENFQKVKELLLENYYSKELNEEQLYFAATEGMLNYLNQGSNKWNKIITPTEYKEMQVDVSGELSGIGLVLKFDDSRGVGNVIDTIPGSPSQKAGIHIGDQLLSVDGRLYQGKQFRDMIYDIRGKTGKKVILKLLRGDKVLLKSVRRKKITWQPVESLLINKQTGLINIRFFSNSTRDLVKSAIRKLKNQGAKSLLLDLRSNTGGLFDQSVATADLFVEKGKVIVKTIGRGNKSKKYMAQTKSLTEKMPIVILVDKGTSSGGELFSVSLRENNGAILAGSKTFGKWNVQKVQTLSNNFAVKYTVQAFQSPSGKSYANSGITPDVEIAGSKPEESKAAIRKNDAKTVLKNDPQLNTAVNLLEMMI